MGFSSYTRTLNMSMIETDLLKVFGAEGDLASRSADIGVFGTGVDADEGLLIVRSLNQREKNQHNIPIDIW